MSYEPIVPVENKEEDKKTKTGENDKYEPIMPATKEKEFMETKTGENENRINDEDEKNKDIKKKYEPIMPDTKEKEFMKTKASENENKINDYENNNLNVINENSGNENVINENKDKKKEVIPDMKGNYHVIYYGKEKKEEDNNRYYLGLHYDDEQYYFILKKGDPLDLSFSLYYNKFEFSNLVEHLNLNFDLFPDFKSVEELLINVLKRKEAYLNEKTEVSINVYFTIMGKEQKITLLKREMNDNEKFDLIVDELKKLKNVNDDKFEELKKLVNEFEEETNKKLKENTDILDTLKLQVEQNKVDIDNETKEIQKIREEISTMNTEIKEGENFANNNNNNNNNNNENCFIF